MRLHLGCELTYQLPRPTPLIAMLNVHYSRVGFFERPDQMVTVPAVPITGYRDHFGNWCNRLVGPAGTFTIRTDGIINDAGEPDPVVPDAAEHAVEDLPAETLTYLLGSRYCETDVLSNEAWRLFGDHAPGWSRVQAICDFVNAHVTFDYMQADATRTAAQTYRGRVGVCRDFTHLAITFCRALNIPTRYCTGYVSDIGQPPPYPPMDFAAWMEVWLGGRWHVFDPRNNRPMRGRVLIAQGRDASDVPLTHGFGPHTLTGFRVWIDEIA